MVATPTSFLRERAYLAVSITHFFVDVLNSSRTLLIAVLALNLGLSNAQVGLSLLLYNVGNALTQPLFGWLADRVGPRWLVVGGMGWMIIFYAVAAVAGDWVALVALTVAGLGSGMFHPTGAMVAGRVQQSVRARATAVFFTAGQMGLFIGPILAGLLLDLFNRPGYLILAALALIAFTSGWQWIGSDYNTTKPKQTAVSSPNTTTAGTAAKLNRRPLILLPLIIIATSTTGIAAINFAPKLFTDMGIDPTFVGLLASLLMLGSATGNTLGGYLADRMGGKWVLLMAALGSTIPIYLYVTAADPLRSAMLILAGFFIGMPHSILVMSVQNLLPGRQALASGLVLGFMFFSGSVGSYVLGIVADQTGLATALQATAVLPILAAFAILLLPQKIS
ncbi:MAG: MFS transporter [Anaerolineales bacterium]|nr:MFS transporter [Anaerolineales bacterium]